MVFNMGKHNLNNIIFHESEIGISSTILNLRRCGGVCYGHEPFFLGKRSGSQ